MHSTNPPRYSLVLIATGLIAFSVLLFELSLTRIFSVMLSYHFVFAVISFALLGLGLGGFLRKTVKRMAETGLTVLASLFSLSIVISVILIILLPIDDSAFLSGAGFWVYILVATVPFIFAGAALAGLFHRFAERSSVLYGADLLGAVLGAGSVVWALNQFGPLQTVYLAGFIAGISAFLLFFSENFALNQRVTIFPVTSLLIVSAAWLGFEGEVKIGKNPEKDMYRMLANPLDRAEIIENRWSAFGRTDLVKSALPPDDMTIFVDGSAGSPMYNFNAISADSSQFAHVTRTFGAYFPFYFLKENEKNEALIIGSGGGRDVVISLLGGVEKIIAVEVNPDVVEIVQDYAEFSGGIYSDHPKVEAVVAEGRNFIRSQDQKYDLIMLAIPVTKSSRSAEGFSLTESFMFTLESMREYLDRLTPEGRIVLITHSAPELYKLIGLTLEVFREKGVSESEAMSHIYTMASGKLPTLVIKKTPFQLAEAKERLEKMIALGQDTRFFVPHVDTILAAFDKRLRDDIFQRKLDQVLFGIATNRIRFNQVVANAGIDLKTVTDDRPFFYKFEQGMPQPFRTFVFLIVLSAVFMAWLIFLKPPGKKSKNQLRQKLTMTGEQKRLLLIFFGIGMGFMLVEIALFQKLTFYFGDPLVALTLLLVSLLLGSGFGSFASASISRRLNSAVSVSALSTAALVIVYTIFLTEIFSQEVSPNVISATILLPLGFFMGIPFPISMRLLEKHNWRSAAPLMWGVNGVASVLGSALTMIIGIAVGFSYALISGALLYGVVAALAHYETKSQTSHAARP